MDWPVTYYGSMEINGLKIDADDAAAKLDLSDEVQNSSREIRKQKLKADQLSLSVTPESLRGNPQESGHTPFYQPIGKIFYVFGHSEGSLKKTHFFSFVAASEDTRYGGPNAKYICHTFKCKSEQDANEIAFAAGRTMSSNQTRKKPEKLEGAPQDQLEAAVRWWNACNPPLYHYNIGKDGAITGNTRVLCQVDPTVKTATKVVRLNTSVKGTELIALLAEKFNLGDVSLSDFAVFDIHDSGDQTMLDDDDSPILLSLRWKDPSEGGFWLRKLPNGLVRVPTNKTPRPSGVAGQANRSSTDSTLNMTSQSTTAAAAAAAVGTAAVSTTGATTGGARQGHGNSNASLSSGSDAGDANHHHPAGGATIERSGSNAGQQQPQLSPEEARIAALGPLLPYHPDDEDLLLNVMISRQSGSGLGFKLTPAYLLQMCVSYCALHLGIHALRNLLSNIAVQISAVVAEHPLNPEMLLFWATNSIKLSNTLSKDQQIASVYAESARAVLEAAIESSLAQLKTCAAQSLPLPPPLDKMEWSSQAELRAVITDHYRALDSNMSHESLQEVVQRITAAMPSPAGKRGSRPSAASNGSGSPGPSRQQSQVQSRPLVSIPQEALDPSMHVEDAGKEWEEFQRNRDGELANATQRLGFTASPSTAPMTSTPLARGTGGSDSPSVSAIHQDANAVAGIDTSNLPRAADPPYSPLPEEWEELIDQETQHRFFANHVTRQTSWTDPRDRLSTVTLVKGDRGLGLGISGAKRTYDDRLILGIFVSSLVPGSAAHSEGSLKEGDEILEVNGHSLIGVSREGAIEFLKQVKHGGKVTLLVSQEPTAQDKQAQKLRHTAL